jgi:hypothetical protein
MFNDALRYRNRYGLLAEDVHPLTGELWGNFPQTYSMAGLILTVMRLSRSWEDRATRCGPPTPRGEGAGGGARGDGIPSQANSALPTTSSDQGYGC